MESPTSQQKPYSLNGRWRVLSNAPETFFLTCWKTVHMLMRDMRDAELEADDRGKSLAYLSREWPGKALFGGRVLPGLR